MVSPYKFQVYVPKTPILVDVPRVGTLKFIKRNQAKHPPKLLRAESDTTKEDDSKGGPGGQEKESKGGPGGFEMCLRWMCFAPRRLLFSWCFKSPPPHCFFVLLCPLFWHLFASRLFGPAPPPPEENGPPGAQKQALFRSPFSSPEKEKKRAQAYAYWHVLGTLEASLDLLGGSWQPQPHFQRVLTAGPDRKRLSSWEI
jgi:hypothetical protein